MYVKSRHPLIKYIVFRQLGKHRALVPFLTLKCIIIWAKYILYYLHSIYHLVNRFNKLCWWSSNWWLNIRINMFSSIFSLEFLSKTRTLCPFILKTFLKMVAVLCQIYILDFVKMIKKIIKWFNWDVLLTEVCKIKTISNYNL